MSEVGAPHIIFWINLTYWWTVSTTTTYHAMLLCWINIIPTLYYFLSEIISIVLRQKLFHKLNSLLLLLLF